MDECIQEPPNVLELRFAGSFINNWVHICGFENYNLCRTENDTKDVARQGVSKGTRFSLFHVTWRNFLPHARWQVFDVKGLSCFLDLPLGEAIHCVALLSLGRTRVAGGYVL